MSKEATEAQTRAYKENLAIYMLTGFKRTIRLFIKRVVSKETSQYLVSIIDLTIIEIKNEQAERAERKRQERVHRKQR